MKRKSQMPPGTFIVAQKECRQPFRDEAGRIYPAASAAFYRVVEAFCPCISHEADREYSVNARRSGDKPAVPSTNFPIGIWHTFHTATNEQRQALDDLFRQVQAAMEAAYKAGVDHGRGLLAGLAKGEITVAQLNTDSVPDKDDGS